MYFLTYIHEGSERIGVLDPDTKRILPLSAVSEVDIPGTMLDFISSLNGEAIDIIKLYLTKGTGMDESLPLEAVTLCSPIPRPQRNIICLGLNYKEHVAESASVVDKQTLPQAPVYFTKLATNVLGPDGEICSHRAVTKEVDYEVELAVVMGKDGTNIPRDQVEEYIFGYSVFNDITARDIQRRHGQWMKGKSLDTFSAMGPYLVHRCALPLPLELDISSRVNGELRQNSNTSQLIFDIPTIISELSQGVTLRAGDIIATGTPSGVAMGMNPPVYLQPGDVVECTVEGIGTLRNTVK